MTHDNRLCIIAAMCALALMICDVARLAAQAPLDWSADDSLRIAWLQREGIRIERRHAIVWAPRDSIRDTWVTALADTLDRGVARLRQVMSGPYDWQRIGDRPVTFYLSPGRFVSHGTGSGAVFIPVSRVHERLAPFLHEASHELLAPQPPFYRGEYADSAEGRRVAEATPLWLFEGLPDYLAQTAAPAVGLHEGDVFEIGGLARVDSVCAARVQASPHGQAVIDVMGRSARLAALFTTERTQVAPVFYACGQSLTRYVIEHIGVRAAVGLMPAIQSGTWQNELELAAGQSLETLRRTWLELIGLAVPDSTADLKAFRKILDDLNNAFELRDADLFVRHFARDGDFMQAFGRYRATRGATHDFMDWFLSGQTAAFRSREVGTRIRRVSDDVAFVEAEFTGEGIRNADGSFQPPRRGQMMLLLQRRDGTWQILAYRYLDIHARPLRDNVNPTR